MEYTDTGPNTETAAEAVRDSHDNPENGEEIRRITSLSEEEASLLYSFFLSPQNTVPTKQIGLFVNEAMDYIESGTPGMIVYGIPRVGKTRAAEYLEMELRRKYGENLPVYYWSVQNLTALSDKEMIGQLLRATGDPICSKGNSSDRMARLVTRMSTAACRTPYRKAILIVDEAQNMRDRHYDTLITLYNDLDRRDYQIRLTVILLGQPELKQIKQTYMREMPQVVGRFMTHEYEFRGIQSADDMIIAALSLENQMHFPNENCRLMTASVFFPEAVRKDPNFTIAGTMPQMFAAFARLGKRSPEEAKMNIPMQLFIETYSECLRKYGAYSSNPAAKPNVKIYMDCARRAGFGNYEGIVA